MNINIGERIAYFRNQRGYSVNYLANQAGVSQSYLREIEMGHYENPSVDILDALCEALGISLSEFFDASKDITNIDSAFLKEIASLSPRQRDCLHEFLESMRCSE